MEGLLWVVGNKSHFSHRYPLLAEYCLTLNLTQRQEPLHSRSSGGESWLLRLNGRSGASLELNGGYGAENPAAALGRYFAVMNVRYVEVKF